MLSREELDQIAAADEARLGVNSKIKSSLLKDI